MKGSVAKRYIGRHADSRSIVLWKRVQEDNAGREESATVTSVADWVEKTRRDSRDRARQEAFSNRFSRLHRKQATEDNAMRNALRRQVAPPARRIKPSVRAAVFERDNFTCCRCGWGRIHGKKLNVDHKIPVALGGTDNIDNLQTLCWECNIGKGAKPPHEHDLAEKKETRC